jgi:integrase/recombinase XerC
MATAIQRRALSARDLVDAFLAGRNERTERAYRQDLDDFRSFVGAGDGAAAAQLLLGAGQGNANALALQYKSHLLERGLAAATVNRRLAALRSMVRLGRLVGLVGWTLEVQNVRAQPYRDTRGPGREGFLALLAELRQRSDAKAVRDRAILRLLYERALRCCEVTRLDLADVDLGHSTLSILGKGRTAKEPVTLAASTLKAIAEWIAARGSEPGPLFCNLDNGHRRQRLSGTGVYDLVRRLGELAGIRARPHGLRHAAITEALDRGQDVRAVQRFSRHRDLRVLLVYDDCRRDLGGEVARAIAEPESQPTDNLTS